MQDRSVVWFDRILFSNHGSHEQSPDWRTQHSGGYTERQCSGVCGALTARFPVDSQELPFSFSCANTAAADVAPGVKHPPVLGLGETRSGHRRAGGGCWDREYRRDDRRRAFAVATVNLGASETISVVAENGNATLPISILICQTNPTTAACPEPPSSGVATQINRGDTPTFGIFITGTGTVPFDPGTNRIFVRFKDAKGGVTRGGTSVVVRTAS